MADVRVGKDNEHPTVVKQLLELELALLQQLSQTKMERARFPGANGATIGRLDIERCCRDAFNLFGDGL